MSLKLTSLLRVLLIVSAAVAPLGSGVASRAADDVRPQPGKPEGNAPRAAQEQEEALQLPAVAQRLAAQREQQRAADLARLAEAQARAAEKQAVEARKALEAERQAREQAVLAREEAEGVLDRLRREYEELRQREREHAERERREHEERERREHAEREREHAERERREHAERGEASEAGAIVQRLAELEAEIREQGGRPDRRLLAEWKELRLELSRLRTPLADRERTERGERSEPARRAESRAAHLREAADHLDAAGLRERAEDLRRLAAESEGDVALQRRRAHGESAERGGDSQVRELNQRIDRLEGRVEELTAAVRRLLDEDR